MAPRATMLLAATLLLAALAPGAEAVGNKPCTVAQTLRTQDDFDQFFCTDGVSAGLTIWPLPNTTLSWSFPSVRVVHTLRVFANNSEVNTSIIMALSFPELVTVSAWIDVDIVNISTMTTFSLPKLAIVVSAGAWVG